MYEKMISIILPIFNKETKIARCIDSILKQTYSNFEVILVDDKSTDSSGEICDRYSKMYVNIFTIHCEKNGGPGKARNIGLDNVRGEYIAFADPDDYVSPYYLEFLYRLLIENNADISSCNYIREEKKGKHFKDQKALFFYNGIEAVNEMWYEQKIFICVWGKLYKRELWNNIKFRENYVLEDYVTTYKIFHKAEKIVYSNERFYYYCYDNHSQTRCFFDSKKEMVDIAMEMIELCREKYPMNLKAAICKGVDIFFQALCQVPDIKGTNKAYYKNIILKIKSYRKEVIWNKNARIKTRGALLVSYLGFRLVRILYRL